MSGAGLSVDVGLRRGSLDLDVSLKVAPGEVVAVVGPNGAGKSTLLQIVAGLVRPDRGTVRLGGQVLDTADRQVSPQARRIGLVFQDYVLFDHLCVRDNVAFGPRSRGMGRRDSNRVAGEWLDRLELSEYSGDRPATLSGGQRQRVALARALAGGPHCLLLDEPLAALDARTRDEVRRTLRRHLGRFEGPTLLVTHEPLEALALADRLIVLEDGHVTQEGSAQEVARRPRSEWVARLVGLNLFAGSGTRGRVVLEDGGDIAVPGVVPNGRVLVAIHPHSISVHRQQPTGSPRNVWEGDVAHVEFLGERVRVEVAGTPPVVAEVTAGAVADLDLATGGRVWVSCKASDITVYAA